jgi:hypothetical protein
VQKKDYRTSIEQLFHFCRKISKTQEYLVNEAINKTEMDETLTTIQNIMKMIV